MRTNWTEIMSDRRFTPALLGEMVWHKVKRVSGSALKTKTIWADRLPLSKLTLSTTKPAPRSQHMCVLPFTVSFRVGDWWQSTWTQFKSHEWNPCRRTIGYYLCVATFSFAARSGYSASSAYTTSGCVFYHRIHELSPDNALEFSPLILKSWRLWNARTPTQVSCVFILTSSKSYCWTVIDSG